MLNQHAVVSDNSNTDEVKSVDEAGPSAVPTFSQEDDMDSSISSTDPSYAVSNSFDEDAAEEGLSDANASEASDWNGINKKSFHEQTYFNGIFINMISKS